MSKFEKTSLENIKVHCDFLNESYGLNLPYPNWRIFCNFVIEPLRFSLSVVFLNKLSRQNHIPKQVDASLKRNS